jgi:hypothetical protein
MVYIDIQNKAEIMMFYRSSILERWRLNLDVSKQLKSRCFLMDKISKNLDVSKQLEGVYAFLDFLRF